MKRLSICIPTHNGRGQFLRQAIASIQVQISASLYERVEICVSDNASEDGTREWLEHLQKTTPIPLVYHRHPRDLGWNVNIRHAIELAQGDYCWFLASDDAIANNGISTVLQILDQYPHLSGISVNRANMDRELRTSVPPDASMLLPKNWEQPQHYSYADVALENLGLYLTFFSGQIFKRAQWLDWISNVRLETFRYFTHVYVLGKMMQAQPHWFWEPQRLVINRTNNDTLIQDMNFTVYEYRVSTMVDILKAWGAVLGRDHPVFKTLAHKGHALWWNKSEIRYVSKRQPTHTLRDDWAMLIGYSRNLYFLPAFWRNTFPTLLIPHWFVKQN